MNELVPRVMRLQRAAWRLRGASARSCRLPFALALMTDEHRSGDLVSLIARLPPASASCPPVLIVFRHYGLDTADRARLAGQAYAAARSRRHLFLIAGGGLPADGVHNADGGAEGRGWRSASVHTPREAVAKRRWRPDMIFVSPVFPTRSHPGARALGPVAASAIARGSDVPAFALGGMTEETAKRLEGSAFTGLAAIGAFTNRA